MTNKILSYLTYFSFAAWAAIYSMNAAIIAPTNHVDGAFQTASGLFRLGAGQFPGKDFFP